MEVPQIVEAELQQCRKRWKMASGKMVLEIRPNINVNKGKAVKETAKLSIPGAFANLSGR
jgi:trehalose-6-phosphatase